MSRNLEGLKVCQRSITPAPLYVHFRLYRRIVRNPSHPERNGTLVVIVDYVADAWGRPPALSLVKHEAEACRRFYASYDMEVEHVIAVYRGTTVEYLDA